MFSDGDSFPSSKIVCAARLFNVGCSGYLVKLKQYDYVKDMDKLEEAAYQLLADSLPDEVRCLESAEIRALC